MRILATLVLLLALVTPVFARDFGAFNSRLIPVEIQAWWTPAYGHIHLAAMLPIGQVVKGTLSIPIRVVMHDNPSTFTQIRVDTDQSTIMKYPVGNLKCANPGVCAWSFTLSVDTTKMSSGWRELRLRAETTTRDGKKFLNSSGIPINVQNGGSVSNYNRFCNNTSLIGRGWYEGFDYTNAIIDCVPLAPVHGTLVLRARAQQPSAHLTVDLDKSHYIPGAGAWPESPDNPGVTLFDKGGDFQDWIAFGIDTTQLANGWHSFQVKSTKGTGTISKCTGCPNVTSFPSGVAKVFFYVQN